jgi:hypothetical protein
MRYRSIARDHQILRTLSLALAAIVVVACGEPDEGFDADRLFELEHGLDTCANGVNSAHCECVWDFWD